MDKLRKKRLKKSVKKKKKKRKFGEEEDVEEEGEGGVEEGERLVRLKAVKPNKAAGGGKRAKIKGRSGNESHLWAEQGQVGQRCVLF